MEAKIKLTPAQVEPRAKQEQPKEEIQFTKKVTIDDIKAMEISELLKLAKHLYASGARRRSRNQVDISEKDALFTKAYDRLYNLGYTVKCIINDLPPQPKRQRKPKSEIKPETKGEIIHI